MPTLYYAPGACSLAVHVVLEWIGQPYETVKVDLHRPDPEYRRINPAGSVPALVEGDAEPLTQCAAILGYLGRKHPAVGLLGDPSPEGEARLLQWMAFLTGDLHPAFWPVFTPARYTASHAQAARDDAKVAGVSLVRTRLALLERHLAGREWIVGDRRTIVDAYATPMLNWAVAVIPGGLDDFPAARAHRARMLGDTAVRRVMRAEGLTVEDAAEVGA